MSLSPKVLDLDGCFSRRKPYHVLSERALWQLLKLATKSAAGTTRKEKEPRPKATTGSRTTRNNYNGRRRRVTTTAAKAKTTSTKERGKEAKEQKPPTTTTSTAATAARRAPAHQVAGATPTKYILSMVSINDSTLNSEINQSFMSTRATSGSVLQRQQLQQQLQYVATPGPVVQDTSAVNSGIYFVDLDNSVLNMVNKDYLQEGRQHLANIGCSSATLAPCHQ